MCLLERPGAYHTSYELTDLFHSCDSLEVFFPCLVSFHGLDFVAINLDSQNHIKAVLRSASFITAIRSREAETTFTCSDEWKPGSWMV